MLSAQDVIDLLELQPLPMEGGYFYQTYKSTETIPRAALPPRYQQPVVYGTAIYALLTSQDFSAMHRLDSDEIYHFYLGDPLEMLLLRPDGSGEVFVLGQDLLAGMRPQKVVERGVWQGSRIVPGQYGFTLIGTTMAPGFAWQGFELGRREALVERYPDFRTLIELRVR